MFKCVAGAVFAMLWYVVWCGVVWCGCCLWLLLLVIVVSVAGCVVPPFTRVCLNFNHLDLQSRRGDIILATFKRVMVTSAVFRVSLKFSPR